MQSAAKMLECKAPQTDDGEMLDGEMQSAAKDGGEMQSAAKDGGQRMVGKGWWAKDGGEMQSAAKDGAAKDGGEMQSAAKDDGEMLDGGGRCKATTAPQRVILAARRQNMYRHATKDGRAQHPGYNCSATCDFSGPKAEYVSPRYERRPSPTTWLQTLTTCDFSGPKAEYVSPRCPVRGSSIHGTGA